MRYQCTECEKTHDTFDAAAHCCWGVGGVIEVDQFGSAVEHFLDSVAGSLGWTDEDFRNEDES